MTQSGEFIDVGCVNQSLQCCNLCILSRELGEAHSPLECKGLAAVVVLDPAGATPPVAGCFGAPPGGTGVG